MSLNAAANYFSWRNLAILVLPSLLGLFLFMTPVPAEKGLTIPVAMLANWLKTNLGAVMPWLLAAIVSSSALFTLWTWVKPAAFMQHHVWQKLFKPAPVWLWVRLVGAVFIVATLFAVGPAAIHSSATGGLVFNDLLPVLLCVFVFAGLFLPLLLNFGLLEMIGTLMTKIMRPVFRLPGRSAVDCIASWLGDGFPRHFKRHICAFGRAHLAAQQNFAAIFGNDIGPCRRAPVDTAHAAFAKHPMCIALNMNFDYLTVFNARGAAFARRIVMPKFRQAYNPMHAATCAFHTAASQRRPNGCPPSSQSTPLPCPEWHSHRLCPAPRRTRCSFRFPRPINA